MRKLFVLVFAAVLSIGPAAAFALDLPRIDLMAGVFGGANVNILPDADEEDEGSLVYPGFVGLGWFIGGTINFDYRNIIGVGIEFLYSREFASGNVEWDGDLGGDNKKENSDFTLEASALHIPLYARASVPSGVVRPFLDVGVDFAVNRGNHAMVVEKRGDAPPYTEGCTPGVNCDPLPAIYYQVDPVNSYASLLLGIGMEIDAGPLTIPIEIRGLLRPGLGTSIHDRVTPSDPNTPPPYSYRNDWMYQVFLGVGISYNIF